MKSKKNKFIRACAIGGSIIAGVALNSTDSFAAEVEETPQITSDNLEATEENAAQESIQKMEDAVKVIEGDAVAEAGYVDDAQKAISDEQMTDEKADELVDNGQQVLNQAQEKNEVVKNEYEKIVSSTEETKNEFDAQADNAGMTEYAEKVESADTTQEKVDALEAAKAKGEERIEETELQIEQAEKEYDYYADVVGFEQDFYNEAENRYNEAEKNADQLEDQIINIELDEHFYRDEIAEYKEKLQSISEAEGLDSNISVVRDKITELKESLSERGKRLEELSAQIAIAVGPENVALVEEYKKELELYEGKKKELAECINTLEQSKKTYDQRVEEYNKAVEAYDEKYAAYTTCKEQYEKVVEVYNKLLEELNSIDEEIGTTESNISATEEAIKQYQTRLQELENLKKSDEDSINTCTEIAGELQTEIDNLTISMDEIKNEMEGIEEQIEAQTDPEVLILLKEKYRHLEDKYLDCDKSLSIMCSKLESVNNQCADARVSYQGHLDKIQKETVELEQKTTEHESLKAHSEELHEKRDELDEEVFTQEMEKDFYESEIANYEMVIDDIYEEDVYDTKKAVQWYENYLVKLQNEVNILTEEVENSRKRIADLEPKIISNTEDLIDEYNREYEAKKNIQALLDVLENYDSLYKTYESYCEKYEAVLETKDACLSDLDEARREMGSAKEKMEYEAKVLEGMYARLEAIRLETPGKIEKLNVEKAEYMSFIEAADNYEKALLLEKDAKALVQQSQQHLDEVTSSFNELTKIVNEYKESKKDTPAQSETSEVTYDENFNIKISQKVKDVFSGISAVVDATITAKVKAVTKVVTDATTKVKKTVVSVSVNAVAKISSSIFNRGGQKIGTISGAIKVSLNFFGRFFGV